MNYRKPALFVLKIITICMELAFSVLLAAALCAHLSRSALNVLKGSILTLLDLNVWRPAMEWPMKGQSIIINSGADPFHTTRLLRFMSILQMRNQKTWEQESILISQSNMQMLSWTWILITGQMWTSSFGLQRKVESNSSATLSLLRIWTLWLFLPTQSTQEWKIKTQLFAFCQRLTKQEWWNLRELPFICTLTLNLLTNDQLIMHAKAQIETVWQLKLIWQLWKQISKRLTWFTTLILKFQIETALSSNSFSFKTGQFTQTISKSNLKEGS